MSARIEAAGRGIPLDVRHLEIVSAEEGPRALRTVRCPAVERAVTLEQCLACPDAGGRLPPRGRTERVACRHPLAAVSHAAAVVPASARALLDRTPVAEVMTTDVVAVHPELSVEALTSLLLERRIGGAPVVDDSGRPIGIVTGTDLLAERFVAGDTIEAGEAGPRVSGGHRPVEIGRGVHLEIPESGPVAEVMTAVAYTVPENAPVSRAAALMTVHGVHRLVVVTDEGRVSGLVTTTDIVRWIARRGGFLRRELKAVVRERRRRRFAMRPSGARRERAGGGHAVQRPHDT